MAAGAIGRPGRGREAGRRQLRKILDAAKPAAGAPADCAASRQVRLELLRRDRELILQPSSASFDLDVANVLRALDDLFGQREAVGEILEVGAASSS